MIADPEGNCKLIATAPMVKSNMAVETSSSEDQSSKKNHHKIPKRVHKSEREKKKREHLNDLFLALANSVEASDQNNGKASVLIEATQMVRDTLAQIECLRKENTALLSESHYVDMETRELKDETSALEVQVGELRKELKSRVAELLLDLNTAPPENYNQDPISHDSDNPFVFPPCTQPGQPHGQILEPFHLAAVCSNMQALPDIATEERDSRHVSIVRKPQARYPTPSDQWPSQILEKQLDSTSEATEVQEN